MKLKNPKARATEEWIGKTPDSVPPPTVVRRILERHDRRCHRTGALIHGQRGIHWDIDHVIALINWTGEGHGNRESNMAPILHGKPHQEKTAEDRSIQTKSNQSIDRQFGIKPTSHQPMPGSRKSKWKKKYNRQTKRWETVPRTAPALLLVWLLITEHIPVQWGVPNLKGFQEATEQDCRDRRDEELSRFGVSVRLDCLEVPEDATVIINPETDEVEIRRPGS